MSLASATTDRFRSRIESGLTTVQAWEADPSLLFECRCLIPFHLLLRDDDAGVPEGSLFSPGPPRTEEAAEFYREDDASYQGDDLLLKRLTLYFQKHGMTWCNNPPCVKCGCKDTEGVGVRGPVTVEEREGGASRVELYKCPTCNEETTTFPRYNSPRKLLETRKGRCGEYANLFGLFCRAAGFECRYISDFTDHVWVEVWSNQQQRWIMADACEGLIDRPSMYEDGWGKKLNYILGITVDHVEDVTRRYTRKFDTPEFTSRRREICPNGDVISASIISNMNASLCVNLNQNRISELNKRSTEEQQFFADTQKLRKWTKSETYSEGRLSGSLAWRSQRNELNNTKANEKEVTDDESTIPATGSVFHVETFHPNPENVSSDFDLPITVMPRSDSKNQRDCIIVSGVSCALAFPLSISIVVVDEANGCILQSRSFASWLDASEFINTIPNDRIVALCGDTWQDVDEKDVDIKLSRLGGFNLSSKDTGNNCILFIGQTNRHPDWAQCSTSEYIYVKTRVSLKETISLKLKTERNTAPRVISCRLFENCMPLNTQLLATEAQKRAAFLSFWETNKSFSGYTTRPNAPVYLIDKSAFPLYRSGSDGGGWNTFHVVPECLVSGNDNGIVEDTVVPKFDIPMDASFFSTLFGNTLLVNDTQQEVDTKTALHNSRLIAIYFSAHWCPPCRKFTPMLCELYQHLKDEVLPTHGLEVVFVSSDRDPSSFRHYSGSMPWLSLPYENRAAQQSISARFGVRGIPALVVLDAISGEIVVSQEQSRSDVMRACQGGDASIENMLVNEWFLQIPARSQQKMQDAKFAQEQHGQEQKIQQTQIQSYLFRKVPPPPVPVDPSTRIKEIFAKLVAEGMSPNTAAATAISTVAREQKSPLTSLAALDSGSLNDGPWSCIMCTDCNSVVSNAQPSTVYFNGANSGTRFGKLIGAKILRDPKRGVIVSILSTFSFMDDATTSPSGPEKEGWSEAECIYPGERSTSEDLYVTRIVVETSGDGITDMKLVFGSASTPSSVKSSGENKIILELLPEHDSFDIVGFHGWKGDSGGISSLGLVCHKSQRTMSSLTINVDVNNESKGMDEVERMVAKMLKLNGNDIAMIHRLVTTANKYLLNVIKGPSTPKFRHFRLSNKISDRITSVRGGISLLIFLGFSIYETDTDYMASIPLWADLDHLERVMAHLLSKY